MKPQQLSSGKSSRGFLILMIIFALVIVAEVAGIYLSRESMIREKSKVARLQRDLSMMNSISPALTEATAREIADARGQGEAHVEQLRGWLSGGELAESMREAEVPAERTDAYFDLAAYVEGMKAMAQRHEVEIAADERFGFSEYENGGPEKALIELVFRQRQALTYLLETLMAAKPQRLLEVLRSGSQEIVPARRSSQSIGADEFEWDSFLSLRKEGHIQTRAYRIGFRGETAVLRSWLNRLAEFELPVVVRLVEVAPADATSGRGSGSRGKRRSLVLTSDDNLPAPLVGRSLSDFVVTLEVIELVAVEQERGQR